MRDSLGSPMDIREKRTREIQEQIRQVLLQDWDPIGVADIPEARAEYDSYVGGVYRLLAQHAAPATVAAHLASIEGDQMGLPASPASRLAVATKLCSLDVQLDASHGAA